MKGRMLSTRSRLAAGALASGAVALAGHRRDALTASGALGTVLVGTPIFAFGGRVWSVPVVGFFIISSALSNVGRRRKAGLAKTAAKGSRRDAGQVLANGVVGGALALTAGARKDPLTSFPAFLGSIAAVTADTWSTEIGALSPLPPRSIITGRTVPVGISGGVTPLGFSAALGGGAAVGLLAWLSSLGGSRPAVHTARQVIALGAAAGIVGSVADSLAGATIQRSYRCPSCEVETEQPVHGCGTACVPVRGWAPVNNDVVNLFCSIAGAVTGAWLGRRFRM